MTVDTARPDAWNVSPDALHEISSHPPTDRLPAEIPLEWCCDTPTATSSRPVEARMSSPERKYRGHVPPHGSTGLTTAEIDGTSATARDGIIKSHYTGGTGHLKVFTADGNGATRSTTFTLSTTDDYQLLIRGKGCVLQQPNSRNSRTTGIDMRHVRAFRSGHQNATRWSHGEYLRRVLYDRCNLPGETFGTNVRMPRYEGHDEDGVLVHLGSHRYC